MRPPHETALLNELYQLAYADWMRFLTEIPRGLSRVSRDAQHAKQIAELVEWAESVNGPGLPALRVTFDTLFRSDPTDSESPDSRRSVPNEVRWIKIPAATFWMGAQNSDPSGRNFDKAAYEDESPVHAVSLDEFQMASFPVTVAQFAAFVESGGYHEEEYWLDGGFGELEFEHPWNWEIQLEKAERPGVDVSWFEAAAFAKWAGCRLPTEAEWEHAAQGMERRIWPWGDEEPDASRLNFKSTVGHPTPAGTYLAGATPEGIEDLAGNIWEWCADRYGDYPLAPVQNPQGAESGQPRVLRGGSWYHDAANCRCCCRFRVHPEYCYHAGFRLVRS